VEIPAGARPVRARFRKEDVRQLFRVIDWLMELPPRLQEDFWRELEHYKEGRKVTYAPGQDVLQVFSPDYKRVMWTSTREGKPGQPAQLYIADFTPPKE
jgi:hypothetical protein